MARRQLEVSNEVAAELAGSHDSILKTLEEHLDAQVFLRGNVVTLDGEAEAVQEAATVVRELSGHGIGRSMHEDPQILNYGAPGRGPVLAEGMTLAIEPMITAGGPDITVHDDRWSISTTDGSLAAHFEHTVAVTAEGPKVLTATGVLLR